MIGLQKHKVFNCNEMSNEINCCKECSAWWHQTISSKVLVFIIYVTYLAEKIDLQQLISALLLYAIAGKTIPSLFHLDWTIKSNIYYKSKCGNWLASVFNVRVNEATSRRWNSKRGQKYQVLEKNSVYPTLKYELNSPFIRVVYYFGLVFNITLHIFYNN